MRQIAIDRDGTAVSGDQSYGGHAPKDVKRLRSHRRTVAKRALRQSSAVRAAERQESLATTLMLWRQTTVHRFNVLWLKAIKTLQRLLRALLLTLRRPFVYVQHRVHIRERRKNKHMRLNALILLVLASGITMGLGFFDFGLAVTFNGEKIGFVSDEMVFEDAVSNVNDRISRMLHEPYVLAPTVAYNYSLTDVRDMLTQTEIENILYASVDGLSFGYALTVDNVQIGVCSEKGVVDRQVEALRNGLARPGVTVDYDSDVKVTGTWVTTESMLSEQQLAEKLSAPVREALTVTMAEGDTLQSVAAANGLDDLTLKAYNPSLADADYTAGQVVTINPELPVVSMAQTSEVLVTEVVPFTRESKQDDTVYQGDVRVTQEGVDGERRVTYAVRSVNGFEQSRTELDVVTTLAAVPEITSIGTKKRPPTEPTGTYIRSYNGVLTSNYGWRRLFGRANLHTGVDFAGPYGSPIVASDGGTVVFAGWKGTYGYCVIIDHGGGLETLYAHNSSIIVRVGQKVAQGQQIAKMGSTGKSTGNHSHLEFRENGRPVNPWKYLK